jgi:hypothetical protein
MFGFTFFLNRGYEILGEIIPVPGTRRSVSTLWEELIVGGH